MTFTVTHTFVRTDVDKPFFGAYAESHPDEATTKAQQAQAALKLARKELGVKEVTQISEDRTTATTTQIYASKAQYDQFQADHDEQITTLNSVRRAYMQDVGITHTVATEGE